MKHKLIIALILLPLCCCCFARQKINLNPREAFVYNEDIIGKPSPDVVDKEKENQRDLDEQKNNLAGLFGRAPAPEKTTPKAAPAEEPKIEVQPDSGATANKLSLCKTPCDDVSSKPENYKYLKNIGLVRLKDLCICPKTTQPETTQINY